MKKSKLAAVLMVCMLINSTLAIGCSKKAEPEDAPVTKVTVPSLVDYTSDTAGSPDASDSFADPSSSASDASSDTSAPDSTETMNPDAYLADIQARRQKIVDNAASYESLDNTKSVWCFVRKADHEPSGTYETFSIKSYNGAYINDHVPEGDKVIYFTFDCGYPSNRTVPILDTLKKHGAKANFFITKMYLEECSDYAKRMKEEGHFVCNHTVSHSNMTVKSISEQAAEILDVEQYFYEKTGYQIDRYFRFPEGSYSPRTMQVVKDAGYYSVFWSLAYDDYDQNNMPTPEYVVNHFTKFHHNGAVVLMHNDCQSNVDALDSVLTLLEGEGYRFGTLDELDKTT